eukprot:TRINITY_DN33027_c0_g1_i1.p1 TRINITY_DN33027_c0_g1~~TRINITY_DN33027_c0_g1_i1.p1  ORF type:complete len:734 (-),score=193.61 TRINITY_DN33027_c0_g1_i1:150-2351(-)
MKRGGKRRKTSEEPPYLSPNAVEALRNTTPVAVGTDQASLHLFVADVRQFVSDALTKRLLGLSKEDEENCERVYECALYDGNDVVFVILHPNCVRGMRIEELISLKGKRILVMHYHSRYDEIKVGAVPPDAVCVVTEFILDDVEVESKSIALLDGIHDRIVRSPSISTLRKYSMHLLFDAVLPFCTIERGSEEEHGGVVPSLVDIPIITLQAAISKVPSTVNDFLFVRVFRVGSITHFGKPFRHGRAPLHWTIWVGDASTVGGPGQQDDARDDYIPDPLLGRTIPLVFWNESVLWFSNRIEPGHLLLLNNVRVKIHTTPEAGSTKELSFNAENPRGKCWIVEERSVPPGWEFPVGPSVRDIHIALHSREGRIVSLRGTVLFVSHTEYSKRKQRASQWVVLSDSKVPRTVPVEIVFWNPVESDSKIKVGDAIELNDVIIHSRTSGSRPEDRSVFAQSSQWTFCRNVSKSGAPRTPTRGLETAEMVLRTALLAHRSFPPINVHTLERLEKLLHGTGWKTVTVSECAELSQGLFATPYMLFQGRIVDISVESWKELALPPRASSSISLPPESKCRIRVQGINEDSTVDAYMYPLCLQSSFFPLSCCSALPIEDAAFKRPPLLGVGVPASTEGPPAINTRRRQRARRMRREMGASQEVEEEHEKDAVLRVMEAVRCVLPLGLKMKRPSSDVLGSVDSMKRWLVESIQNHILHFAARWTGTETVVTHLFFPQESSSPS